jgi:tetratricopeptide (TPR) repeat protein/CHAT domain-containing protein
MRRTRSRRLNNRAGLRPTIGVVAQLMIVSALAPSSLGQQAAAPPASDAALPALRNSSAYLARGKELLTKQDYERALADFDAALASDAANIEGLSGRADALAGLGRWSEAAEVYRALAERDRDNASRWHDYGMALYNAGEYEQAISQFDAMLRIDDNDAQAFGARAMAYVAFGDETDVQTSNLLKERRYYQAVRDYTAALLRKPKDAKLLTDRAIVHIKLKDYPKALADANAAIVADATFALAYNTRGDAYYYQGDYENAIASFGKACELDDQTSLYFENRAYSYKQLRRWDEALADYTAAIALDSSPWRLDSRGDCYVSKGDYESAVKDFAEAIRISPDYAPYWESRGNALRLAGRWDEAIRDYDQAISLDDENAARYNVRGDAYYYHADTLRLRGDQASLKTAQAEFEKAVDDFTRAIDLDRSAPLYWENRGVALRKLGLFAEALADFQKAIELAETDPKGLDAAARYAQRGHGYYGQGDYENAVQDYRKALEHAPNAAYYHQYLAEALRLAGNFAEAAPEYDKAIELDPRNAERYMTRGNAYRYEGQLARAIEDFDKAIALNEDDANPYNYRGICREKLGDDVGAIADYTLALERLPNDPDFRANRGAAYLRLKQYDMAIPDYDAAIAVVPHIASNYNNRGDAYWYLGQYAEAEADYSSAIDADDTISLYWENRGYARKKLAEASGEPALWEGSIADFTKSIEITPDNALRYNGRGDVYFARGAAGDYDLAAADYGKAHELDPKVPAYVQSRGVCYRYLGRWDDAYKDFADAIAIDVKNPYPYNARGHAYSAQGRYEEAIADYTKSIELNPNDTSIIEARGNLHRTMGNWDLAFADLNKAIELDPTSAARYNARGDAYYYKPDYKLAEADYTKAIELDPKVPLYWENRGLTRRLMDDLDRAFADLAEAIRLDPTNAARYNTRGLEYYNEGNDSIDGKRMYDLAIADYTKAIELDKTNATYFVNRALAHRYRGDDPETWFADFDEAVRLAPTDPARVNARGEAYYAIKEYPKAIGDFTKAIELGMANAGRYNSRGNAYHHLGNYEAAIADYSKAIELDPNENQYELNRANSMRLTGDLDRSLESFNATIARSPQNPEAYNSRGDFYYYSGDFEKAIVDYAKAIELGPTVALYWENRGIGYQKLGQWDLAFPDFEKAIGLDTKNPYRYSARGYAYKAKGDYDKAIADFTTAAGLAPSDAELLETRGECHRLAGRWDAAIKDYNDAVALAPNDAKRYNARGDAYYSQAGVLSEAEDVEGSELAYDKAIADYSRAIQIDPANVVYLENRGISYRLSKRYGAALRDFNKAIGMDAGRVSLFNSRGHVFFELGEYANAADDYGSAVKLAPGVALYYENRGDSYRKLKDWERAFPDYNEAVRLESENPARFNARGVAYHESGDYDKAIADFDQAIALNANEGLYVANRSRSRRDQLWNRARAAQAEQQFEEALAEAAAMLAIEREWLGADHYEVVFSVDWIADVSQEAALAALRAATDENAVQGAVSKYLEQAEQRYQEAFAWREQHHGKDDWQTINAWIALEDVKLLRAMTVKQMRKFLAWDEAEQQAAVLFEDAHYGESLREAQGALELARELGGESSLRFATSLGSIARAQLAMGANAEALSFYQQAHDLTLGVVKTLHPEYSRSLSNLGEAMSALGKDRDAAEKFEQAADILAQTIGTSNLEYADAMSRLAAAFVASGDFLRAEDSYNVAETVILQKKSDQSAEFATVLERKAELYQMMDEYRDQIVPIYEKSLAIREAVQGKGHPDVAFTLYGLATWYERSALYADAGLRLQRALSIVYEHIGNNSHTYTERQQIAYQHKLQLILDGFLRCMLRSGDASENTYREVLAWKGSTLVRQRAQSLFDDSPELAEMRAEQRQIVPQLGALQTKMAESGSEGDAKKWEAKYNQLNERREELELAINAKIRELRLAQAVEQGEGVAAASGAESEASTFERVFAALPADGALVDYLEYTALVPDAVDAWKLKPQRRLAAFVVRRGLPSGERVAMFDLYAVKPVSEAIAAWRTNFGLGETSEAAGRLLREMLWNPLEASLAGVKTVIISPDGDLGRLPFAALPGNQPDSYMIEDLFIVLAPVPQLIPELLKRPTGAPLKHQLMVMGGVNYDLRPGVTGVAAGTTAADRPLAPWERPTTASSPISSDAVAMRSVASDEPLPFLEGSDIEASEVKRTFADARELPLDSDKIVDMSGADATEERFRELAPQCYLLHLSTHGFFAAENLTAAKSASGDAAATRSDEALGFSPGMLSGLVLSGANLGPGEPDRNGRLPDDGFLTADEIAVLPLGKAQLVVLSACDTALGKAEGGEGVLGVQRAFQVAGARATIASLWKVNDKATMWIMKEFYTQYLSKGKSPLEALRLAQLAAIANPDQVDRGASLGLAREVRTKKLPPKYWAAFTLSGSWQ